MCTLHASTAAISQLKAFPFLRLNFFFFFFAQICYTVICKGISSCFKGKVTVGRQFQTVFGKKVPHIAIYNKTF